MDHYKAFDVLHQRMIFSFKSIMTKPKPLCNRWDLCSS